MKNLTYLLSIGLILCFTACGGEEGQSINDESTSQEVSKSCGEDCSKSCCLGCKASKGDSKCLSDHSCCMKKEEAICCCGDANCEGPKTCPSHNENDDESHNH